MREVVDFQVSWKKVVQGSCWQFKKLFFIGRASVYFAGLEPLLWVSFAGRARTVNLLRGI